LHSFPGWGNNILKTINQKKLNEVLISWQCPVNWIVLKPVYFSTFGIYDYFIIPLKYVLSVSHHHPSKCIGRAIWYTKN
jgi:hypothetical protein